MNFDTVQLKDILLKKNYVSEDDFKLAEEYATAHKTNVLQYFFDQEILSEEIYGQAIAEYFSVPYINPSKKRPDKDLVLRIPAAIAREFRVILYEETPYKITVVTDNPKNEGLLVKLKELFPRRQISVAYSSTNYIDEILKFYRTSLNARFNQIIENEKRVTPTIVEEIMKDAIDYGASDIHFEPQEGDVVIRFRIDGVLKEAGRVKKFLYSNILNRIKVQARLRIDDHFSAQDGSIRYIVDNKRIDLRVSILPTLDGEKIVIRILGEYVRSFGLRDLGLEPDDYEVLQKAAHRPFGMILVTGPTGSGKSTTLYSILKILNEPDVNITTIEDPVEYKVIGVNQIQVSPQTNLTFAKGLRSIVRQDPDIILVGEIRDVETAEIAVNAALTGHLLLSTFHANDAATAIPRLLDMKIEPFILASTLNVIVAQRLVRRICQNCRKSKQMTKKDLNALFPLKADYMNDDITVYEGAGCTACNNSGYRGRIGIFEIIQVTPEVQELIIKSPSSKEIWTIARKQGSKTMFEDAIKKVLAGHTTIDEIVRVIPPT